MRIVPMTAAHAEEICSWRYAPPYDLFDWPAWDALLASSSEAADPDIRSRQFTAVVDEAGSLLGFAQFFPLLGVTRLGLGLHPRLCGNGLGSALTRLIADEAIRRAPGDEIDLEVLTWNRRAIRAYEKAGFCITDSYVRETPSGPAEFHCMVDSNSAARDL
ncbi:GNAT family N-acetyltransferase [Paenibacillus sp. 1P07SE]|uniref:GNAT family N-acetyltransferase n=1 Tax=Paenibacillus sp. 1P07SE TaxID=3132209 RepID=UPI0039A51BFA